MKLKDLIKKHPIQSIIKEIFNKYPTQRKGLGVYRKMIQKIKQSKDKNPDRTLFVEKCEIDGEIFYDAYFTKREDTRFYFSKTSPIKKGDDGMFHLSGELKIVQPSTYSIIGINLNKIANYKIDKTSVESIGDLQFIVGILYKMTWFTNGVYAPLNNRFYHYSATENRNKRIYIKKADATNLTFGEINHPTSVSSKMGNNGLTVGTDTSSKRSNFTVECQYINGKIVSTSAVYNGK